MAKGKSTKNLGCEAVTRGTTNVFADLGFADAEERQTKLRLAHAINTILEKRHLVQAEAAKILGVNQPKVSALVARDARRAKAGRASHSLRKSKLREREQPENSVARTRSEPGG